MCRNCGSDCVGPFGNRVHPGHVKRGATRFAGADCNQRSPWATGANPAVYALIIGLATSNAFILPTHPVNALIMGPGGYQVKDFVRGLAGS